MAATTDPAAPPPVLSDADRIRAIVVGAADEVASEIDELVAALAEDVEERPVSTEWVVYAVQEVFDRTGPGRDRRTDWTRCTEEPWYSLAGIVRGGG